MDNALGFTPLQASSLTPYLTVATATGEYYSKTQVQTIIDKLVTAINGLQLTTGPGFDNPLPIGAALITLLGE